MNRFQKADALFPTRSTFLAFVCSLTRRRGLWRWSMFGRGWICTSGSEFSSALTRPGVRFVPGEGRGHVSKKAYWLVVEGVPIGRRASLAAYRSTITHVTAICDKKKNSAAAAPRWSLLSPKTSWSGSFQWGSLRRAARCAPRGRVLYLPSMGQDGAQ